MYTHLWKWWTIRDKLSIIHNLGWKVEINGKLMGRQSRRPPPRAGGEGAKRGRVLRRIGSDVGNCKVSACSMMFKLLISMFYLDAAWCAYSLLSHVLQVSGHACLCQVVWTVEVEDASFAHSYVWSILIARSACCEDVDGWSSADCHVRVVGGTNMPPAEFCTPLNNIRCRLSQSPVLIQCLLVTLPCHHNCVYAAEPYDLCCVDATLAFLCRYASVTMLHIAITSISMNLQCCNISNTRIATLLHW